MPLNWKTGKIRPTKEIVLKNNLNLSYSFSVGVTYEVKNIVCRPNNVDFEFRKLYFKNIDFWEKGIEFV